MVKQQGSFDDLWKWMGEDAASHQALLDDLRQEWECLKKNDLSSLLPLLRSKETHLTAIKEKRESMVQILKRFAGEGVGKDRPGVLSDLYPFASPSQAQKIKNYQRMTERTLHQIGSLNERNKRFIQETLNYLGGLFSLFTSSHQERLIYAQRGKAAFSSLPACRVSRKV
jgi:flagellar biosynthesis/type III secretory pathway chaperone